MPRTDFRASYRLQLHKDFTFEDATKVVPYLDELGISHVYLSPILESRAGSNHGYDGIDPTKISVERGGEEGFVRLVEKVKKTKGIDGFILDIVPNHLASDWKNPAWWSMLKLGRESKFWSTFDVKPRNGTDYRVILPVLGKSRQAALASREIKLGVFQGELVVKYYDKCYPLDPKTYALVLRAAHGELAKKMKPPVWMGTLDGAKLALRLAKWFAEASGHESLMEKAFEKLPLKVLEETLQKQNFILRDWRSGSVEVNYRRFFDINDLAGIRIEEPSVFKWSHSKIASLMKEHPSIHGLRIDHVDGLTFPGDYLKRLSKISKNVWVEKILGEGEKLPSTWPVLGSTGYEFSNVSARLFVDLKGLINLHSHYLLSIDDRWERFHDCVYESKHEMLESHFVSELNFLTDQFYAVASKQKKNRGAFSREDLHEALAELTSSLKVYRTYAQRGKAIKSRWLNEALAETEGRGRVKSKPALNWLRATFLAAGTWSEDLYLNIKRWEQLTGPVMAKGLEDTALYRYCPLLSLNGVGGEPDWRGDGSLEYHSFLQEQLREHPQNMNTSSTHDTKRSEDVRSRIHVLSEFSSEWIQLYESFSQKESANAPGARAVYLVFETMIGAWPFDGKVSEGFIRRLQDYLVKASREAKTETSWAEVNAPYEESLRAFVLNVLKPRDPAGKAFLQRLQKFAEVASYFGALNSLALVVLKACSPGVPDFYQGCDVWDLSLVDPDNRRPVDFELRRSYLRELKQSTKNSLSGTLKEILTHWQSGKVKLWVTWKLLQLKSVHGALFAHGEYIAIEPEGLRKQNLVAFMRKHGDQWLLVVVPRFLAQVQEAGRRLQVLDPQVLATEVMLPSDAPGAWTNVFTGEALTGTQFSGQVLFREFPMAVFLSR